MLVQCPRCYYRSQLFLSGEHGQREFIPVEPAIAGWIKEGIADFRRRRNQTASYPETTPQFLPTGKVAKGLTGNSSDPRLAGMAEAAATQMDDPSSRQIQVLPEPDLNGDRVLTSSRVT